MKGAPHLSLADRLFLALGAGRAEVVTAGQAWRDQPGVVLIR